MLGQEAPDKIPYHGSQGLGWPGPAVETAGLVSPVPHPAVHLGAETPESGVTRFCSLPTPLLVTPPTPHLLIADKWRHQKAPSTAPRGPIPPLGGPPAHTGEAASIPGSGRSPREGNSNPLQYSCLEGPMDGGAWWAAVCGVTKSRIPVRLRTCESV